MNFFGIGPMELILVFVIALIVFGPGKMPEIGKTLGSAIREFRKASQELTSELTREVEINKLKEGVKALQAEATQVLPYQAAGVTVELDEPAEEAAAAKGSELSKEPESAEQPESTGEPETAPEAPPARDSGDTDQAYSSPLAPSSAKSSTRKHFAQRGAAKRRESHK